MKLAEVRDVVRDLLGRADIPPHLLDYALNMGRREIEKRVNGFWMRAKKSWNTVADQSSYNITVSTDNGLNLPDYKDARILLEKQSTGTLYSEVEFLTFQEADLIYGTTDEGEPEAVVVDNTTLSIYPIPDEVYNMVLYHWNWTANPTSSTGSDDLTDRFPEALVYAGAFAGNLLITKDQQTAEYYRNLLDLEIRAVKKYDVDRTGALRIELEPKRGPHVRRTQRRNLQVWV